MTDRISAIIDYVNEITDFSQMYFCRVINRLGLYVMAKTKIIESSRPEVVERLKGAIEMAGGVPAVAKRSGVPFSSIHEYLKGTEMKLSRAAQIAQACDFSLDWLAWGGKSAKPDGESESTLFGEDMMLLPVNFWMLAVGVRMCQEAFSRADKPTLQEVVEWLAPNYRRGYQLPDMPFEFKDSKEAKS